MKKLTTEQWIQKAKNIHSDDYDYSLVNYINAKVKVKIVCSKHGVFEMTPDNHIFGNQKCPCCFKGITSEDWIIKAKEIHNDKYDYSLVNYEHSKKEIKIICPVHGVFEQKPNNHLNGKGCKLCNVISTTMWIENAKKIHNEKYDYSLVKYKGRHYNIKIICKEHGIFEQEAGCHLNGAGCPECAGCKRYNTKEWIEKAVKVHSDIYDYSLSHYITKNDKVKIICKKHNYTFEQIACNHLFGQGCPICKLSKGEMKIKKFLDENKINYEIEKKFKTCKHKGCLPFDFYLPEYNCCIEFDGIQHFQPHSFGSDKSIETKNKNFESVKYRDNVKNEFCKNEGINLVRISYLEIENIFSILKRAIENL